MVHCVGYFLERGEGHDDIQRDFLGVRATNRVDNAKTDGNACQAAACAAFMERDVFFSHMAIRIQFRV